MHIRQADKFSENVYEYQCVLVRNRNCLISSFMIVMILLSIWTIIRRESLSFDDLNHKGMDNNYLVYTSGCHMTKQLPKPLAYFKKPNPIICSFRNNTNTLVSSDEEFIWVNETAIRLIDIEGNRNITCCYYEFEDLLGCDKHRYSKICVPFWNRTKVTAEFLKVHCLQDEKVIYIDFHLFVPRKGVVDIRCERYLRTKENLNVLMLGLHAISRAHFHRAMNKTALYLMNNLTAIEMFGFNKIGNKTNANILPAISGKYLGELKQTRTFGEWHLDSCKFIWDYYKASGYRTALTEEFRYSFSLRYPKSGFCRPPTDYYSSYFMNRAKSDYMRTYINSNCYGIRTEHEILLTYMKKFISSSNKYPYFGLFLQNSFTQDDINYGYLTDDAFYSFIKELPNHKSFNKTILILFSDHGYEESNKYNETFSGKMEFRLPLLSFVFPTWFKHKFPTAYKNLKYNAHSLTTPFDFYETLKDIIDYRYKLSDIVLKERNRNLTNRPLPRGISLFLQIPERRSCKDAGIHLEYCACKQHSFDRGQSPISMFKGQSSMRKN